jgi:tyrosyl-tRNA synthetase
MSKSLGNYIGINEPPEQIYGKTMSIPDSLIEKYIRLISGLDPKQQAEVLAMKPRDAKAALARQLVKRLHGEEAAARAEADFDSKFRKRELPVSVEEQHFAEARNVVDVLVEAKLAKSRNEARRLIEQGGVRVDGQKVDSDYEFSTEGVLQVGKRNFVRIRLR